MPPSPSNDDLEIVETINRATHRQLTVTGRSAEGTLGGAIFVDLDDGTAGVVTQFLGPLSQAHKTTDVVNVARDAGLPVPRHHLVVPIGEDIWLVQERLQGEPVTAHTPAVIDAVVEVNDRFAQVVADRRDLPTMPLCLSRSGDPHPRHEVLASHSDRSRRILEAIREVGRRYPYGMEGNDLLHIDLSLSNVLFDQEGVVTGVVDWNLGAFRGDRHLALVKTRFEQEWALHEPEPDPTEIAAAEHLDRILATRLCTADLQRYWAHRMLYQLYWALRYAPPEVVDWHLAVAEARLL